MKAYLFYAGFYLALASSVLAGKKVEYIGVDAVVGGVRAAIVPEDAALIHSAQFLPVNKSGKVIATNAAVQTDQVLMNLKTAFNSIYRWPEVVKLNIYVTQNSIVPEVRKAVTKFFGTMTKPAISYVTTALPDKDALVAMDAIAVDWPKAKKGAERFHTNPYKGGENEAQLAILPAGSAVYISGQAKEGADLTGSTQATLEQLGATLTWLKLKKADVVQVKAFMRPMKDAAVVRAALTNFFGEEMTPPLVLVEWISAKPQIEIEMIAAAGPINSNAVESVSFSTPPGMTPSTIYSKVATVERGKRVYFSSLYGGKGSGGEQIKSIYETLGEWAGKAGSDLKHLVKATYYVTDADAGTQLNTLRPMYYDSKRPPAATKAMVKGVGMEERTVAVEMVGVTR